jgi:hypothetical protein
MKMGNGNNEKESYNNGYTGKYCCLYPQIF